MHGETSQLDVPPKAIRLSITHGPELKRWHRRRVIDMGTPQVRELPMSGSWSAGPVREPTAEGLLQDLYGKSPAISSLSQVESALVSWLRDLPAAFDQRLGLAWPRLLSHGCSSLVKTEAFSSPHSLRVTIRPHVMSVGRLVVGPSPLTDPTVGTLRVQDPRAIPNVPPFNFHCCCNLVTEKRNCHRHGRAVREDPTLCSSPPITAMAKHDPPDPTLVPGQYFQRSYARAPFVVAAITSMYLCTTN